MLKCRHMLGCGGDLHAQQGAIESPNHPQRYPSNTECVWQINVNNGYHVNLNFEPPFELEIQEPCSGDFVEVSVLSLGLHGKIICIISARQRSCGKVMFSQASVCSQGCGGGYSPPRLMDLGYGWQTGTHPTGMLSCSFRLLLYIFEERYMTF